MDALPQNDTPQQAARTWSRRLGALAAGRPAIAPTQPNPAFPDRLSSILRHLRQLAPTREHMAHKLRAEELIRA